MIECRLQLVLPGTQCLTNKLQITLNHAICSQCCLANEGHSKPAGTISASHMQLPEATLKVLHAGFLVNDMHTEVVTGLMMG